MMCVVPAGAMLSCSCCKAKPLLDWKETIGYGECVLNRTQAMTNNPDFPFGAGQQFCCMPWTSFSGLMNTTYKGLTFLADQVNGQYGKVQGISQAKFHCENDPSGIYKSWGKDGGAVMVILFLVAIFLLIVGTNLRNRFERAGNGFGSSSSSSGGLSIRADPLYGIYFKIQFSRGGPCACLLARSSSCFNNEGANTEREEKRMKRSDRKCLR